MAIQDIIRKSYKAGRNAGWAIYTTIPALSFLATDKIVELATKYSFKPLGFEINPLQIGVNIANWIADDPLTSTENLRDASFKTMIASGVLLATKRIGRYTEKLSNRLRSGAEAGIYGICATGCYLLNKLNSADAQILQNNSVPELLNETARNSVNTLDQITNNAGPPTLETALNISSAVFSVLTIKRIGEIFYRGPFTKERDRLVKAEKQMKKYLSK